MDARGRLMARSVLPIMAAMASETGSPEQIRGRGEELLDERFLQRLLRAERAPLWILLEAAEHFFHAGEPQRAQEFLTHAAEAGHGDPLLDELQAKVTWIMGDREGGLRRAREGAAKWELTWFHHLAEAMEANDREEIMEPVWRTKLHEEKDQDDFLVAARLRLSGAGLEPPVIAAALGVEADWIAPDLWALESMGTEDFGGHEVDALLDRLTAWPADASLKSLPGVEQAVMEILMILRHPNGGKGDFYSPLRPEQMRRLAGLGLDLEMLG